jgi:hypothetical protein
MTEVLQNLLHIRAQLDAISLKLSASKSKAHTWSSTG